MNTARRLAILALLLLSACAPAGEVQIRQNNGYGVSVWHDDARGVTCWIYSITQQGGISCLPDSQLERK
jgi:hypothetical protein